MVDTLPLRWVSKKNRTLVGKPSSSLALPSSSGVARKKNQKRKRLLRLSVILIHKRKEILSLAWNLESMLYNHPSPPQEDRHFIHQWIPREWVLLFPPKDSQMDHQGLLRTNLARISPSMDNLKVCLHHMSIIH